jgi:YegS/Rv2252/BmrU family lipid kinase
MERLLFVFNPNSGKGQMKNRLLDIVKIFTEGGYEVTVYPTRAPGDGYSYILENGARFDVVCCSGGDGTLNETVGAVMKLNDRQKMNIPVGYIPSGTTNDFAGSLGIPRDMRKAAQVVVDGKRFACDIGMAAMDNASRNFNYVAAFGAFTEVSYATPQELKNALGHQAYIIEGVRSLSELKPQYLRVKSEGIEVQGNFLYGMVSNTESVGGMKGITGRNVDLCDGLFEVTLVREINNPVEFQQAVGALITQDTEGNTMVESFKTSHIEFECAQEVAWTFDGEFGGAHRSIIFDVKPQAVEFIVKK